jgi:hypothetical protein
MRAGCDKLAVLEGYPMLGAGPENPGQGENGYADFEGLKNAALKAATEEPEAAKKELLQKGLAIAAAAIPIPVAGWIVAGVVALGTFFGITIRGRTQHVPRYPDAHNAGQAWAEQQWLIYLGLPVDAKAFMIDKTHEFNVYQYNVFGQWWGGVFIRDFGVPGTLEQFRRIDPRLAIYGVNGAWMEIIMASADKDSVGENMKTWFFDNYERIVLKPLNDYMLEKYNQTVDQYIKAGGKLLTAGFSGAAGIFLIAALMGAVFIAQPKPKRGRQ